MLIIILMIELVQLTSRKYSRELLDTQEIDQACM